MFEKEVTHYTTATTIRNQQHHPVTIKPQVQTRIPTTPQTPQPTIPTPEHKANPIPILTNISVVTNRKTDNANKPQGTISENTATQNIVILPIEEEKVIFIGGECNRLM